MFITEAIVEQPPAALLPITPTINAVGHVG